MLFETIFEKNDNKYFLLKSKHIYDMQNLFWNNVNVFFFLNNISL